MKKVIKDYTIITIGTLLVDLAVFFFMIPSNVVAGSLSGLSVVIANFIPVPISVISLFFNVLLLAISFFFLGKEFGAKTVYASILFPILLYILEVAFPNNQSLTNDVLLDTISYLLIVSIGQAMLFHVNASSGGIDIVAKLLNKFTHIELGQALTLSGFCVSFCSIFVYDTKALVLSVLATYANGIILDNYINGFNRRKRVCIISKEYKQIQNFIMKDLDRGVTLYQAVGGFNNEEKIEIITILTRSEYAALMNYLHVVDEKAFVTVSTVNEVVGNWTKNKRLGV